MASGSVILQFFRNALAIVALVEQSLYVHDQFGTLSHVLDDHQVLQEAAPMVRGVLWPTTVSGTSRFLGDFHGRRRDRLGARELMISDVLNTPNRRADRSGRYSWPAM